MHELYESETQIVSSCLSMLAVMRIYAWRNNSGALKNNFGRTIHFGKPGSSDILGILPGGRFLAVECKMQKGKVTPLQQDFLDEVNKNGGLGIVVHSPDELLSYFDKSQEEDDGDFED